MDSIITESNNRGKAAQIKAYINAVLQANLEILQEVRKMGSAKTLQQVLVESGITVDWEAKRTVEIAQNALKEGLSKETVQRITGLDIDAISKMQAKSPVVAAR
jgi:predicted transposase YdaD